MAALSEQRRDDVDEEEPEARPVSAPPLRRPIFVRGETPANPLFARSMQSISDEASSLSSRCPRPECTGDQAARVSRVRYEGGVRYALVAACQDCAFRYTRYFKVVGDDEKSGRPSEASTSGGPVMHESPFQVVSPAVD